MMTIYHNDSNILSCLRKDIGMVLDLRNRVERFRLWLFWYFNEVEVRNSYDLRREVLILMISLISKI